jgi:hypothetical protein
MRPDIGRIAQVPAAFWPASGRTSAQFQGGLDHGRAGRADARLGAQLGFGRIAKTAQIAEAREQILRDLQDILPRTPAAQEDREELGVGKGAWPAGQQAFTRTRFGSEGEECRHKSGLSMRRATSGEEDNNSYDLAEPLWYSAVAFLQYGP